MPVLLVEKGPDKGISVACTGHDTIVGRGSESALCIHDHAVSRSHFKICHKEGDYFIEDCGSLNGTLVDGQFISGPLSLRYGAQIRVGETLLLWLEKTESEEKDPLVNKKLGGYQLLQKLGKGGMGTVYKARQISLERDVAIKLLLPDLASDNNFVHRFLEEAKACAKLNHPNIIQVYDVGEAENYFYFSMEYANNGSIQEMIAGGRKLEWEKAVPFMLDTLRGLEFAEKKKMVHRDIKPDNLMLAEDNRVKIGDLGLAKRVDQKETQDKNMIFGTPHFIAPEQAKGSAIDHRADIYSCGASFYRILSGTTPFHGNNIHALVMKHIREEPPPLKSIAPSVPDELCEVIKKMMQKDPNKRYSSNAEIIQVLEQFIASPSTATTSGTFAPPTFTVEVEEPKESPPSTDRKKTGRRGNTRSLSKHRKYRTSGKNSVPGWLIWTGAPLLLLLILLMIPSSKKRDVPSEPSAEVKTNEGEKEYRRAWKHQKEQGDTHRVAEKFEEISRQFPKSKWGNLSLEEAQKIRKNIEESEKRWQEVRQHRQRRPDDLFGIKEGYRKIVRDFPYTESARKAEKEIREIEERETKEKPLPSQNKQDIEKVFQEIQRCKEQKEYRRGLELIEKIVVERPALKGRAEVEKEGMRKHAAYFLKEVEEKIAQEEYEEARIEMENASPIPFPEFQEKIESIERRIRERLSGEEEDDDDEESEKILSQGQEIFEQCLDSYAFQDGMEKFRKQMAQAKGPLKKKLGEMGSDLYRLDLLFKNVDQRAQKEKHAIPPEGMDELKKQLPQTFEKMTSVRVTALQDGQISFVIQVGSGASLKKVLAIKNFSPWWVYHYLLYPFKNNPELQDELAVYCFFYRLYLISRQICESGEKTRKGEEVWARVKEKLERIEKEAAVIYQENIMPQYREVHEMKESGDRQEFAGKLRQLKQALEEYRENYQYTKFFLELNK